MSVAAKLAAFAPAGARSCFPVIHASQSMDSSGRNDRVFKELGLYSLRKKIEDTVTRAEIITSTALEVEETRRIKQEAILRKYDVWDDLSRVDESLNDLAHTIKLVNELKDLQYKHLIHNPSMEEMREEKLLTLLSQENVEEAKLIKELADMDVINHQLLKHAYKASLDVSKFLDHYEMSKLLNGPYDKDGACVTIRAGPEGITSEIWAEKLLRMYLKWAEKQGHRGRIVERRQSKGGGVISATIEFESEYVYGFLEGEKGVHRMVQGSSEESIMCETYSASVEVIPLFVEGFIDLQINDDHLEISYFSSHIEERHCCKTEPAVIIRHIPSGTTAESSGERSVLANKIKALNRLKSKLLVLGLEQGSSELHKMKKGATTNVLKHDNRRYIFHPQNLVQDVKFGIQLPDLNSVLDGNIEPLLRVRISQRYGKEVISAGLQE